MVALGESDICPYSSPAYLSTTRVRRCAAPENNCKLPSTELQPRRHLGGQPAPCAIGPLVWACGFTMAASGYINQVHINAADRDGLGLPTCSWSCVQHLADNSAMRPGPSRKRLAAHPHGLVQAIRGIVVDHDEADELHNLTFVSGKYGVRGAAEPEDLPAGGVSEGSAAFTVVLLMSARPSSQPLAEDST